MDDSTLGISLCQLQQRRATLAVVTPGMDPPSDDEPVSASSSRRSSRAISATVLKNDLLLHEAVIKNDPEAVKKILKEPVDVNCRNNYGRAPIHWAASRGSTDIMEMLIAANCDIEATDKHGMRPLLMAAWHGHSNAVRMLINCGASVTATNKKQLSLLMCGARNNRLSVVNLILEALEEPKLEDADSDQQTALYHAAMGGHLEVVRRLVEVGANTRTRNKQGRTPLHAAAEKGHVETVSFLLRNEADCTVQDDDGNTALHVAVENQQTGVVQELLSNGMDPDLSNLKGYTVLHMACTRGSKGIIESALQSGAQVNKKTKDGSTALHLACFYNEIQTIELLIAKGADVNAFDSRLQTPMHIAAERGFTEACKLLLSAGACIDQKEQGGKTPLYMAARGSFTAIVDMIIKTARLDYPIQNHPDSVTRNWSLVVREVRSPLLELENLEFALDTQSAAAPALVAGMPAEEMKSLLWSLAHKQLGPQDWRKLALHWRFTDEQVRAIEHQYTGPKSYKQHGYRVLLIWHCSLSQTCHPLSELADSLSEIGRTRLAEHVRKRLESNPSESGNCCRHRCVRCVLI